jgi:hypothetical protein
MSDDTSEVEELEPGKTSIAQLPWEEARLLAGRLESEGIPATVFPEAAEPAIGGFIPVPALDAVVHDVLVDDARAEDARAIAKDILEG